MPKGTLSPELIGASLDALDTPALVVDLDLMERNIQRIVQHCRRAGVHWRPHCKTHKSGAIAQRLIAAGAIGITCAKLAEAAVMVEAGIKDILIANQIAGPIKIARLVALCKRADIAVGVDHPENVAALAAAAQSAGITLRVLIEVDTGTRRAGVQPDEPVVALAKIITHYPALRLAGIYTWEGHTTQIVDPDEKRQAITSALQALTRSAAECRAAGIPIDIVSCGGTGTYSTAANVPGITEIQAGGGIFGDIRYRNVYHVDVDYALSVLSTVTSRPTPRRIVCDAGKKAMSTDAGTPLPMHLPPMASVGFSAEHGKLELQEDALTPRIGERIRFVPGYADTTVHLHDKIYGVRFDGDGEHTRIETVWPIQYDARLK